MAFWRCFDERSVFEFSKEMILRLISIHIYVAVLFPYGGIFCVEPALGEAFQGPDFGLRAV
jgi:hypothetical protein